MVKILTFLLHQTPNCSYRKKLHHSDREIPQFHAFTPTHNSALVNSNKLYTKTDYQSTKIWYKEAKFASIKTKIRMHVQN